MSYPYRCKECGKRQSKKRKIELYVIEKYKVCDRCGGELRLDRYRMLKEGAKYKCQCDGLWFPHRKGCKGCNCEDEGKIWARQLNEENHE